MTELWLEYLLRMVLYLTQAPFYAVAIAVFYWAGQRDTARHALILLVLSICCCTLLKAWWQIPPMPGLSGWRFPSGHGFSAATFWLWLCLQYPRWWLYGITATLLPTVGVGLCYFGYHLPVDVAAGYGCAYALTQIYNNLMSYARFMHNGVAYGGLLMVILLWIMVLPYPVPFDTWCVFAFLATFLCGAQYLPHQTLYPSSVRAVVICACFGLEPVAISLGIWSYLEHPALALTNVIGLALWCSYVWPLLWQRWQYRLTFTQS